jgi:LuxR family transcriptional regulator/LuxR family quorum-sensing system transcriptional regulator CciR
MRDIILNQIDGLTHCTTPSQIWRYCIKSVKLFGFKVALYAVPPPHKKPTHPETNIRVHGITLMEFQQFALGGLIGEGHLTTSNSLFKAAPFRWTDIGDFTENLGAYTKLHDSAFERGFTDGWIIPVFGPRGRTGLVSYGVPDDPMMLDPEMGSVLQYFGQIAHLRLCQVTPYMYELNTPLSNRETQIISWIAQGKSNAEISVILDISENSIDSYLRRAFAKLGVHDRTSAAVKAISMELVRM